jgi:ribose 5-phosphate isomerase RpiB
MLTATDLTADGKLLAEPIDAATTAGLALGARIVDVPTALRMVDAWLGATFEGRHQRRLDKIAAREGYALPTKP